MTPETLGERIARLEVDVIHLKAILPQLTTLNTFMSNHEQDEKTIARLQADRHRENSDKLDDINTKLAERATVATEKTTLETAKQVAWTAAGVIIAFLALVVTIMTIKSALHGELPHFSTTDLPTTYAVR